jgi:hypothetical protein
MRHVSYIAAAAALAVALTGCGDPYYPGYGNSQAYYSPAGYSYAPSGYSYAPSGYRYAPSGYSYAPSGYSYAPSGYSYVPASSSSYGSRSDYYRNYNGIHAAPERTFP